MSTNTTAKADPKTEKAPDPIGTLLMNALVDQVQDFLDTPVEQRMEACKDLFNITPYPAGLSGDVEGADPSIYDIYLMHRYARMNRDDVITHRRLSCDVVAIDRNTNIPMYYGRAYITPNDIAAVEVYCANAETGIEYSRSLRWTNRPPRNTVKKA